MVSDIQRLALLTISGIFVFFSAPQEGLCLAFNKNDPHEFVSGIITGIEENNPDLLEERFDELEDSIQSSEDPLAEGRIFLQCFIEEINAQYGLNLTLQDACILVRNNLHTLELPKEIEEVVLATIELMESDSRSSFE